MEPPPNAVPIECSRIPDVERSVVDYQPSTSGAPEELSATMLYSQPDA